MKTNLLILLLITLVDVLIIGMYFLINDTVSTELLIGLLIFALLFTLRFISNQIIITNGNHKKN
ncbi:MAG: hypothetical protein MUF43_11460 [Flavobacterium sp.]|jgi:hypothetical protein|nr:hypothetical protein [Flavobacterium sp.]